MARKKMGDTRRPQILEGLLQAVAERGFGACNMSDVAEAAGVSRGILHYYFKNKDEMIAALVAHLRDTNLFAFEETTQVGNAWQKLQASLWYPVNAFGRGGIPLARVWVELWGLGPHHPDVHRFILDVQSALRAHFGKILQEGLDKKLFAAGMQPARLASVILATLEGLILQLLYDPEHFDFRANLSGLESMLEEYLKPDVERRL